MKATLIVPALCIVVGMLSSCASKKPWYASGHHPVGFQKDSLSAMETVYTLFLAGGLPLDQDAPVMKSLTTAHTAKKSGLVVLGDMLSMDSLSVSSFENRTNGSSPIAVLQSLDKRFDDFFLIPGQKEWSVRKKLSPTAIRTLDATLKDVKRKGRLVQPEKGCGMPEVKRLTDNTILLLVDSQWAIENGSRSGEPLPGCELANILEWRQAIKDIIQSHPTEYIIITTHHPVYANGPTAGNYPLSSHLLPVPILGSLITGIKSLIGTNQHFGHPEYEAYRAALMTALSGCQNCIVVSGHEKSLQYYHQSDQHYFIAGSGRESGYARKGERSIFSYMSLGFIRVDELRNGHLRVSIVAGDKDVGFDPVFEKEFEPTRRLKTEDILSSPTITYVHGDSIMAQASFLYADKNFLRGHFYRKAWSQPIKIPVMLLDSAHGGLKAIQLGGGNQTRSLRLEKATEEQYVIRSIDKKVTSVLPPALRGTFAENIVQDGIAASHPYGALVVPGLAKAAGVFYTNPYVVYVPHQEALGIYDHEVGDGVYLFEERPGGNTYPFPNFGHTGKTISTSDLLELIQESPHHVVDQKAVLRARLLDIWLGDWDRHDDQWRWASFENGKQTVYQPIPRDRDQVFFYNDGLLDYIASRPFFNPPLRKFEDKIDYLEGLVWAGKHFDRSFLHELTEEDFLIVAKELQARLTDEVIEDAFKDWPAEIDRLDGPRIRKSLKVRRQDLDQYALAYYKHLAEVVSIPATDDRDIITIEASDNSKIHVTIERVSGSEVTRFYHRVFDDRFTKEIRVFGLAKADSFLIIGAGNPSIRIRVVGGTGKDFFSNQSHQLSVVVHDAEDGITLTGYPVREIINDRSFNNTYDRMDWKLNRSIHFPSPAYFTDEGFGLTYNYWSLRYGFRSDPFQSRHLAGLSYFFNTGGFIGKYAGDWFHALGQYDVGLDAYVTGPTFTQYYYGIGNTYINFNQKVKYHIVSGSQILLSPSLGRRFGFGSTISLTPSYQFINIENENEKPRFIYTPESGLTQDDFGERQYLGLKAGYRFERLDNGSFPSRGGAFSVSIGGRTSLGQTQIHHGLVSGSGSLYMPFDVTGGVVLATHAGVDKLYGKFEFFHALTLGGPDRLRGFRRDRFAGDARFYHATDLRFKLWKSRGVIPFTLGIYGSFDYGRVWLKEESENADQWHMAYGGGIYIVPLGLTAFRIGYMMGRDDVQINIGGALRF